MATRIRLRRVGRKKQPEYRIVVTDRDAARDGRFVETIGHYNPRATPEVVTVDAEKARAWLAKGATPSETVRSLLKRAGVFGGGTAGAATADAAPAAGEATPAEPAPAAEPAPPAEG
jgi:small subunit ribosomal protein S16